MDVPAKAAADNLHREWGAWMEKWESERKQVAVFYSQYHEDTAALDALKGKGNSMGKRGKGKAKEKCKDGGQASHLTEWVEKRRCHNCDKICHISWTCPKPSRGKGNTASMGEVGVSEAFVASSAAPSGASNWG